MKKTTAENLTKNVSQALKVIINYVKDDLAKNTVDGLNDANGVVGLVVKMFGKTAIDKYYDNKSTELLDDCGFKAYIGAGFEQAELSLKSIKEHLPANDNINLDKLLAATQDAIEDQISGFDTQDVLVIFQPQYHPAVVFAKDNYVRILRMIYASQSVIDEFKKNFNQNIKVQVKAQFGDDYDKHLEQTKGNALKENEAKFLVDMSKLGRIGMQQGEDLKYEQTYACWQPVRQIHSQEESNIEEEELVEIETLIAEYFSHESNNHLEKILFVIANFGKGKSVFLRHYAALLAKQYANTSEGEFPVYFNLREYGNYDGHVTYGILADYLETKYQIKVDDPEFKTKRFIFLVDSLDESGELNAAAIEEVVSSVKRIQNLAKTAQISYRIIMTSRPIGEALNPQLTKHKPCSVLNDEKRANPQYIAIYGFKPHQFNDWIACTLKNYKGLNDIRTTGFVLDFVKQLKQHKTFDLYQHLVDSETLSRSELRRPIFSYMIYQLIINEVDFENIGKIGVYLSFLNLLTKEAKHINDVTRDIDLQDEFKFRNILHATAALWMLQRHQGKQGVLNKADICRVLDGKNANKSDTEVLRSYKDKGVTDIQFLSHSYFGEQNNQLHFQHQSFAEILLAEYYLKIFICFGLSRQDKTEHVRAKLILGAPTEQTIVFLKELLTLLKGSAAATCPAVIEKRKLLFPLMASLATKEQNTLYSDTLYLKWYEDNCQFNHNESEYPSQALEHWCIDKKALDKIINLAANILDSKNNLLMSQAEVNTALYDKELLVIQNQKVSDLTPDMDRWLALLVGNCLYTDVDKGQFFNRNVTQVEHFFDLIRNWNYSADDSAPYWAGRLFIGIDMRGFSGDINMMLANLSGLDFSYSCLKGINLSGAHLLGTGFFGTDLECINFRYCSVTMGIHRFDRIKKCNFSDVQIAGSTVVPRGLCLTFDYTYIGGKGPAYIHQLDFDLQDGLLGALIRYGLEHQRFKKSDLNDWFIFGSDEVKDEFFAAFSDFADD